MKLPSISRFITEYRNASASQKIKLSLSVLSCGVLIVVLFVESYQLFSSLQILTAISRQREVVALERRYWEDVLKRHAGYRDAYFKAGVLSYQLGEKDRASKYIYKALEIDPEFKEGWSFVKKVGF